ncbi:M23 family metallopeptidase [Nocardioides sp. SYSU DS0651]|uniref:M23 family metallopeptidase n=1 Tax=Nocardioides sp. SYSU DS0651 TaxID=3415955 RepID=UPI003F4B3D19
MRSFPSAPLFRRALERVPAWAHPQWLVTGLAVVVALAGLAVPFAQANDRDDLEDRQDKVRGQIADVRDDIGEASRRVATISRKLDRAQGSLRDARADLAKVRGELRDARRTARALARRLDRAEARLVLAKKRLAQARDDVAVQRLDTRDAVIRQGTSGDPRLALVSSFVASGSIEEAMFNSSAYTTIVGRHDQVLGDLVAAEEALAEHKAEVKDARDAVAGAKRAADDNVDTVTGLVRKARISRSSVRALVLQTAKTRRAVVRARAADRAALRRLEKREARIKSKILALSRKQKGGYNGATGGLLAKPGPGPVTSPYGYRRHPIYGYYGLHNGIDFGTGCGAPLWAGESGTVISTYYDEVYGNRLYLAIGRVNGAAITLVYNHLSSYRVRGGTVKRGQVIGRSGATGWSTGCHLHFTVLRNGEPVDPAPYL